MGFHSSKEPPSFPTTRCGGSSAQNKNILELRSDRRPSSPAGCETKSLTNHSEELDSHENHLGRSTLDKLEMKQTFISLTRQHS
ncbi:hypothetical protein H920_00965 [Fukomys damarensis]|uniref:Uncharacterized protein n=1 Tax=Fukomys damarensis TaxID=885580 RepID=A0A091DZT3_FUKDA|nr:hypothetical protein H920_00965 [Fukomys damarensis]